MNTTRTLLAILALLMLQACGGGGDEPMAADEQATIQRPAPCQEKPELCR